MRKSTPGPGSLEYADSLTCLGEIDFGEGNLSDALQNLIKALDIYRAFNDEVAWESLRIQELVGRIFFLRKDYDNAAAAATACLLKCEEEFSGESEIKSNLHLLRGKIYTMQGNLAAAYDQFKRCLSIRKRDGKEKRSVLEVLLEIAGVLFEQGQYKSCLNYYQEALRIKKLLGETETASSIQTQIGISYLKIGKYDEALRSFKEIRAFNTVSCRNVDQAHLDYNIGRAYDGSKQLDEALASYLDAAASFGLFSNNSKTDQTVMASATHNAGMIMVQKDEPGRAIDLFEKALVLKREHLDKCSTDTADTLYWLAKVLVSTDEVKGVMEMYTEAHSIYSRHKRYKEQASCLSELGEMELVRNMEKSLAYYNKAWKVYLDHDLNKGVEAANILYGVGFIHNQNLQSQKSVALLKQCLKIRIQEEGKNSLNVGKTCEQLGSCLLSLNQHEDALKLYVTCLEIYKDILGVNTAACARVMLDIASLYSYKQDFDLALIQFTACLEFMEVEHGQESEEVATVLLRIGQVHDMRVDNEEAMKCVSRALEIRIKLYTKEDVRVAETYLICGKLLEDWGDIDEVRT